MTTSIPTPRVLSIAGTDPSGGAGIQADLKSIAANGGYGMAVVTALVAQNTHGVRAVHTPPKDFLRAQLDAVSDDVEIDAVKIGMLADAETITVVAAWLDRVQPPLVVLDPVMVATSGDRLLDADAEQALLGLLDRADLITPNIPELAVLAGEAPASTWAGVLAQAAALAERHGVAVLAKGGHLGGPDAPDALLEPGAAPVEFPAPRIDTTSTHGTGCSLSAALAALRPRTGSWATAVGTAKAWLTESIAAGDELRVGSGRGPINHFAGLWARGGLDTRPTATQLATEWWDRIEGVRDAIDELPFVRGLGDGTLEREPFLWYLQQDALYLADYARALARASALAPTPIEQAFWAKAAHGAIAAEIELHHSFLGNDKLFAALPAPATTAYTDHLLAAGARGDYGLIIAAILPCFSIYQDVGTRLLPQSHPDHPYASWLDTYADPGFDEDSREAIRLVSEHAARADASARERMFEAFRLSAEHERSFFAAPLERPER